MSKRFKIWALVLGCGVTLQLACDSNGSGFPDADMGGNDVTEPDGTDDATDTNMADIPPQPMGDAGLTFVPMLGDGYKRQFDQAAKPFIPEDSSMDRGDLLIMLCGTDDPTCEDPQVRLVDKANPEEWSPDIGGPAPLQSSFGPTITVTDLPEGTYNLMIAYDSLDSQRRGYGWTDDFPTEETAWGGVISETDLLLSTEDADTLSNPEPMVVEVTLTSGETLDLGDVMLSHYHEQKISDVPAAGSGTLVVGNKTDNAIRLVDLSTYEVQVSFDDGAGVVSYNFPLVNNDGMPIDGTMCGLIPGPGNTVFALFTTTGLQLPDAGFAVQFDPANKEQPHTNVVSFPVGNKTETGPCRAVFHEHNGEQYLFAVAADSSNQGGQVGFWAANISDLATGDVTATVLNPEDDQLFDMPLDSVAAYEGQVYIGSQTTELDPCDGHACAFIGDFDPATGVPTMRMDAATVGDYEILKASPVKEDVSMPSLGGQTVSCADTEQGVAYFSLTVVPWTGGGKDLLVFGNCHELDMYDLDGGSFLDFVNDAVQPGIQGLNAALFGGGYYDLQLSPDGNTLWGVAANKSRIQHSVRSIQPNDTGDGPRISLDRHAAMPIDLTASDLPAIAAEYTTTNRDDFDGVPPDMINDLQTPAEDPGIDLRALFLKKYYLFWNFELSGSLPRPFPVGPTIAVAGNTLWIRGAGADTGDAGQSGLGVGGNVGVLDLDAQRLVLWPDPDQAFYPPFLGLKQQDLGFDLTPARDSNIATAGLIYVP